MATLIPLRGWEKNYAQQHLLKSQDEVETWECSGNPGHHLLKIHPPNHPGFQKEYNFLKNFDHEAFPKVYSYHQSGEHFCYVREYLPGIPLKKFFGQLDQRQIGRIISKLARALAALHFRGLVHGDFHGNNVLFDEKSQGVSLIDFEFISPKHQSPGVIRGLPAVMAPELFWGSSPNIQTDLYALGCILYGLIAGHYPFVSDKISQLIRLHAFEMPPDPTALRSGISRGMGLLTLRLLSKEPGFRMAFANDVIREINEILHLDEELESPPSKINLQKKIQVGRTSSWQDQAIKYLSSLKHPKVDELKMLGELYLTMGKLKSLENLLPSLPEEEQWTLKGLLLNRQGHYDQSLQHFLTNKPLNNTQAILALATAFYYTGHVEEAFDTLEQSETLLQGSPKGRAILSNHRGNLFLFARNFQKAERAFVDAINGAREAGEVYLEALALMNLANVQQGLLSFGMAYENYQKSLELFRGLGLELDQIKVQLNWSGLCRLLGHLEKSEELIDQAVHLLKENPNSQLSAYACLVEADLEKKRGNYRPAQFNLEDAEAILLENPSAVDRGDLMSCHGEILLALNKTDELATHLTKLKIFAKQVKDSLLIQRGDFLASLMKVLNKSTLDFEEIISSGEHLYNQGDAEFVLDNLQIAKQQTQQRGFQWPNPVQVWSQKILNEFSSKIPEDFRPFFMRFYSDLEEKPTMSSFNEKTPVDEIKPLDSSLNEILDWVKEINGETKLDELTRKILFRLLEYTKMERGFVILKNDKQLFVAQSHLMEPQETEEESGLSWSLTQKALDHGELVYTADAQNDANFVISQSISNLKLNAILVLPIRCEGKILGAVYLDSKLNANHLQHPNTRYLMGLADLIGIALKNATQLQATEAVLEKTRQELTRSQSDLKSKYQYRHIIGRSPAMENLFQKLDRVTDVSAPVLLFGESGVGKELFAKAIHFNGPFKNGPWVPANCGAIPENLVESEFFGHERGAFTGAFNSREGLFEQAHGGTLFLDEIGDMPLPLQAKLLRVLQEHEVRRIGAKKSKPVKVRVIAATHQNLRELIKTGKFREDLFYRLNVAEINIPPLRERKEDIPFLIQYFLKKFAQENKSRPIKIDPNCLPVLQSYSWPGNVRELENLISHLCIFLKGNHIGLDDLIQKPEFKGLIKNLKNSAHSISGKGQVLSQAIDKGELNLSEAKRRFEREEILRVLGIKEGKVGEAAKHLGIPRPQLSRLIKYHGLGTRGN